MIINNGCHLCVAGYAMTKDLSEKRTTTEAADESASARTEDRLGGRGRRRG